MKVGYIRVSTKDQNLERQIQGMKEAGVGKIFEEKASGKDIENRPIFQSVLSFVREGDTLWL